MNRAASIDLNEQNNEESDQSRERSGAALELEIEGSTERLERQPTRSAATSSAQSTAPCPPTKSQIGSSRFTPSSLASEGLRDDLLALISELNKVTLDDLAPPDYEALKHEQEHLEGRADAMALNEGRSASESETDGIVRESEEERLERENIIPCFEKRLLEIRQSIMNSI